MRVLHYFLVFDLAFALFGFGGFGGLLPPILKLNI